jgi:hypothetical protein
MARSKCYKTLFTLSLMPWADKLPRLSWPLLQILVNAGIVMGKHPSLFSTFIND